METMKKKFIDYQELILKVIIIAAIAFTVMDVNTNLVQHFMDVLLASFR